MHSFSDVVAALNDTKLRGLVREYAIAGAVAVTFWSEAIATFDVDVLVILPGEERNQELVSLDGLYRWADECGYEAHAEHIFIADVPVQFLPAYSALTEEAVRKSVTLKYGDQHVSVVSREYLIALALDPAAKSPRRRERAALLAESPDLKRDVLEDVMARYNLSW